MGLMLVIFWPELEATNSLLMNKLVGNVIFRPFGAWSSAWSDMMNVQKNQDQIGDEREEPGYLEVNK